MNEPSELAPRRSAWRRVSGVAGAVVTLVGNLLENTGRLVADVGRDSQSLLDDVVDFGMAASDSGVELRRMMDTTPRLARVVGDVLKVAASYRLHRARCDLAGVQPHPDDVEALHRVNAERMYRLCVELRGALIKVGQLASSRVDLLPPAWVEVLSRLQDRVPPTDWESMAARIEHELGPLDDYFAEVDPEPLATASIAQVHAARLLDGTRVVVKVQLPGIGDLVNADLRALRLLARLLDDRFPQFDLPTIADELTRSVAAELDFELEAAQATELASHLTDVSDVVVPRVIETHSTSKVLTLERLDGERLVDFLEACEDTGDDASRDATLETMVRAFCVQVLEGGLFHADPHPGNFLVLPGPRLGLLDFGCVMRFDADQRRAYALLAGSLLGNNAEAMAEQLGELGFRGVGGRNGHDEAGERLAFTRRFLDLFHADLFGSLGELDASDQLDKAMTLLREESLLSVPQDFVLLGRVFAALSGLMIRFKPNINLQEIGWPSLSRAMSQAF